MNKDRLEGSAKQVNGESGERHGQQSGQRRKAVGQLQS